MAFISATHHDVASHLIGNDSVRGNMHSADLEVCPLCAAGPKTRHFDRIERLIALHDRILRLSRREREVFLLLGSGPSNQDLARVLCLSERTVKAHVGRILEKLSISRLQACLVAESYHAVMCTEGQLPTAH
ncbi:DNA-binding CsgD family transcriptional regulator [Catenulispora sp. GAS73]|uniref:helix-turn-helix domain-containing protein n=1 Tax=Catenulispora sp. GAS73 TaxID=3156269 RepID=UPI003514A04F